MTSAHKLTRLCFYSVAAVAVLLALSKPAKADTISGCCGDVYSLSAVFESGNTWDVTFVADMTGSTAVLNGWSLGFDGSVDAFLDSFQIDSGSVTDMGDLALENGPVNPGANGCANNVTHTACLDGLSLDAGHVYTWVLDVVMADGTLLPDIGHIQTLGTVGDHQHNLISADDGITGVPEPGSLMLFGTGLIGMAGFLRRKLMS